MGNLYEMLKKQETFIDEPLSTGVRWTPGERVMSLNEGQMKINRDLKVLTARGSDSSVTNQRLYYLPRRQDNMTPVFERMLAVIWAEGKNHWKLRPMQVEDFAHLRYTAGNPRRYHIYPQEQRIQFHPIISSTATSTTTTATATATATTITVSDTATFPAIGIIKDTTTGEKMLYQSTTATTFVIDAQGRGYEGTTPTAVGNGDTIQWADLVYYYVKKPQRMIRYYNTGTCVFTNGSATVTGTSTTFTNNLVAGDFIGTGATGHTAAFPERYYEIKSVDSATQITLLENFGEATVTTQAYGAGQLSELPEVYTEGAIYWSVYLLFLKDNDPRMQVYLNMYDKFVAERIPNELDDDYLAVSGNWLKYGYMGRSGDPAFLTPERFGENA